VKVASLALAFLLAAHAAQADEPDVQLADGAGRDLTAASCAICHSLDYIPMNAPVMKNRAAWEKTVQKMITRFGAPIDEAGAREILDYLSRHYHE
jgi:cytochrome c5